MRFFLASLFFTLSATLLFAGSTSSDSMGLVKIPKLKALPKPVRAKDESKEAFLKRVRALHHERAKEMFPLQKEFRLAVEDRNRRLLRGEVKQNPSLIDPFDPLFSAYKDVYQLQDVSHDLDDLLKSKQKQYTDSKAWLFVVAIEEYKYADPVLFARRTGEIVKATFQKKLEISERNIITLYNKEATVKNINAQLRKLVRRIQRNDVIYFYYCGHGLSNKSGEELILPYDGMPDFTDSENTIEIERMYNKFLNSKALRTFSFIDASFNGITDGAAIVKGVENLDMRPRAEGYHKRLNILNGSRAQDTANAKFSNEFRLFSYYLVKEVLSEPENAGTLFDSVRTLIRSASRDYGQDYLQEPEFFGYRELTIQN
ncbi:MAG: caspase family protein [Sulfurimonadaceae bacterium]